MGTWQKSKHRTIVRFEAAVMFTEGVHGSGRKEERWAMISFSFVVNVANHMAAPQAPEGRGAARSGGANIRFYNH